jgi:hypothetical protein
MLDNGRKFLHVSTTEPDRDAVLLTDSDVQGGNQPSSTASNKYKGYGHFQFAYRDDRPLRGKLGAHGNDRAGTKRR